METGEIREQPSNGKGHPYRPNRNKLFQLTASGIVATTAMLLVGYLLPVLGLVGVDWAAVYGAILMGGFHPEVFAPFWWAGLFWHYINGAFIFPLLFDFLTDREFLPQGRYARGLYWGVVLWALVEGIVKPLSGDGFFSNASVAPTQMRWLSLVTWLIYGLVLESMTRVRVAQTLADTSERKEAA
jgi:hypothetical protein